MATENKASDKEELIDLNERFHFYVRRVRQLRDESDLETFYKSIATLEDEVKEVRKSYESEISKLKYAIEILNREKSEMEKDIIARKNMEAHLNDRLNVEVDKTQRYVTEISQLKNEIVDKDYQIRELNMNLNQAQYDNSGMKKDLETKTRLAEDLKRQLDLSKSEYKDTTNRLQIVEEKLSFQESFTEERMGELKRRIETYLMQIAELENKCELSEAREAAFPDQLRQVKETADTDLRKFQRDTEEFYKGSIQTLQEQLEEEIGENKKLQGEVERLNDKIVEYRNQVTELKSQITMLEQQKRVLSQSLESERHQNTYAINGLERKLKEVQQELQAKVTEMNQKQDVSASLRAELDAMRALIEEEETRLGIRIRPAAPINYPGSGGNGGGTQQQQQLTTVTTVVEATSTSKTAETTTAVVASTQVAGKTEQTKTKTSNAEATSSSEVQHDIAEQKRPQLKQRDSDWQKMRFLAEETQKAMGNSGGGGSSGSSQAGEEGMQLDLNEATAASADEAVSPNEGYDEPKTPRDKVVGPVLGGSSKGPGVSNAVGPLVGAGASGDKEATPPRSGSSKRRSARNEGEGRDYFEELFEDIDDRMEEAGAMQPQPQDTSVMQSSAIGDIKILEVNPEGKFVRVLNSNEKTEAEFGNFAVQQNIGGHPIAVFRFPPHTKIKPNSTATIWAGCNPPTEALHQPPTDFYWREYDRFNTGPECTTVVCEPSGRSIAWTTPYHRYSKDAFLIVTPTASQKTSARDPSEDFDGLEGEPRLPQHRTLPREEPATLRREKTMPCYVSSRHPHAQPTCNSVHPRCDSPRTGLWGNDNSSVNRQSRSQMTRVPDRVPGEPYTGSSNQVMGSARVMHYQASLRKSATIGNRAPDVILRSDLERPSPFSKPHSRFDDGMKQVQSMYNSEHLPPMPRPPAAVKAEGN
ncbi:hypothetical protein BOX15_Mlig010331g1 [Macrostomum lignano]|uniref:Uncharacterized protein n=2 Tax=Macrostomum lignano TaxID=282301 RepID=A0A267GS44_9PLAT|nr:hypothetical protein BOX15_Mlig010331g1 [Macrostomum lignano]